MITKPLRISRIDWRNPLARGLVVCCALNEMAGNPANLVTATPGLLSNSAWTPEGVKFPSSIGNGYTDLVSNGSSVLPTGPCTVVIRRRKFDGTLVNGAAFGRRSSTGIPSTRLGALIPYTDGTVYWDYGGATAGVTRLTAAGLTNFTKWTTWTFTVGTRGMEIWQGPDLRAANVAKPTRTNDSAPWGMGQSDGASGYCDWAETSLVCVYNRQLSAAEIAQLNANPWQILAQSSPGSILNKLATSTLWNAAMTLGATAGFTNAAKAQFSVGAGFPTTAGFTDTAKAQFSVGAGFPATAGFTDTDYNPSAGGLDTASTSTSSMKIWMADIDCYNPANPDLAPAAMTACTDIYQFLTDAGITSMALSAGSLHVIAPATFGVGAYTVMVTVAANTVYSGEVTLRGTGRVDVTLKCYAAGMAVTAVKSQTITLSGSLQTIKIEDVNSGASAASCRIIIRSTSAEATEWYASQFKVYAGNRTIRFCSGTGITTSPTDTPPNTAYVPRIVQPALVKREIPIPGAGSSSTRLSYGELTLANADGALDYLTAYDFSGRPITIRAGEQGGAFPAGYPVQLVAVVDGVTVSLREMAVKLKSPRANWEQPVATATYAGTGGIEGDASLKGTAKPLVMGYASPVPAVLDRKSTRLNSSHT